MTVAQITGAAPRRARWRELTGTQTDAAGTLQKIALGAPLLRLGSWQPS